MLSRVRFPFLSPCSCWVQVDVPLVLTVTVPDQGMADLFHNTAAHPPTLAANDPTSFASKAQAAAMALTSLAGNGVFRGINMTDFRTSLDTSLISYPTIIQANVSLLLANPSIGFTAQRSPYLDPQSIAMEAFLEAAAFELDLAVRSLSDLPDSIGVC